MPKLGAPQDENPVVLIKDNDDGSYTGIYTVSARGNYEVNILGRSHHQPLQPTLTGCAHLRACACLPALVCLAA